MNIEELAVQGRKTSHVNLAQRTYSDITGMRNATLRNMFSDKDSFQHHNQLIATIKGVDYVDDAKSVKPNSTWFTLEQTSSSVIWIAELFEDTVDMSSLVDEVKQKVHTLILTGKQNKKVERTFSGLTNLICVSDLEQAVKTAYFFANEPDIVIYSPANGNADEAKLNGERFVKLVNDL